MSSSNPSGFHVILKKIWNALTSLWLTLICLGLSAIVIFVGTLDQVNLGIHAAQEKYFNTFLVYANIPGTQVYIPVLPGGYLLCGVLLANLLAAHITRFKLTKEKMGILIIHSGLILILAGQIATSVVQVETQMTLDEGTSRNYSESLDRTELAITDVSNSEYDEYVAFPDSMIKKNAILAHEKLPVAIRVLEYYPNSNLSMMNGNEGAASSVKATQGVGTRVGVAQLPITAKPNERNVNSAFVELTNSAGTLGTWLVSVALGDSQTFDSGGKIYRIQLRPKRYYKSYSIGLIDFKHEKYTGTDIPKSFSSHVRLKDLSQKEDREVLISMNSPLRYAGETFYQASFDNEGKTSILQVVKNPSWLVPYISCTLIALGMVLQFSMHLMEFLKRRKA